MSQGDFSGVQRVVDAAARKGVELDIRVLGGPVRTVEAGAAAVGVDPARVVQALVFVASHLDSRLTPVVCLVSGRGRVDTGLLAAVLGETVVRRATGAEIAELTGYLPTAVPPFGFGRGVRVLMDQDLGSSEWLWAMAGSETAMLRVSPGVLRMLANAVAAPLCAEPWAVSTMPAPAAVAPDPRLRLEAGSHA